jgi:hypothetical protein
LEKVLALLKFIGGGGVEGEHMFSWLEMGENYKNKYVF